MTRRQGYRKEGHRKGDTPLRETSETVRRCAVTGEVLPKSVLLRFVVSPEGQVVPDMRGTLPGRGIWLSARRDVVETATRRKVFSRVVRRQAEASADMADMVGGMLRRRCLDLLGFARRAGVVTAGFDQVKAAARSGKVVLLFEASEGAADGRRKITALIPSVEVRDEFSGAELASVLGRNHVVHVAVSQGNEGQRSLIASLKKELERLDRYWDRPSSSSPRVAKESNVNVRDEPGR